MTWTISSAKYLTFSGSCKMNVILRPIAESDTDQIVFWRNQPEVRFHFINQNLITPEIHRRWLADIVRTGLAVQYILVDAETNTDLGTIYLHSIDRNEKCAEMGIFVGRLDYQGKGICRPAVSQILAVAFEDLQLTRVDLRVLASNRRAIHCYEASGFQLNRIEHEVQLSSGQTCDVWHMAITKT